MSQKDLVTDKSLTSAVVREEVSKEYVQEVVAKAEAPVEQQKPVLEVKPDA